MPFDGSEWRGSEPAEPPKRPPNSGLVGMIWFVLAVYLAGVGYALFRM